MRFSASLRLMLMLFVAAFAFFFLWRFMTLNSTKSKAGADDVIVSFDPGTIQTFIDKEFNVTVLLQSDVSKKISGVTVGLKYDKTKLTFITTDESDSTCERLDNQVQLKNNPTTGLILWTKVSTKADSLLPSGAFCFGKLKFKAASTGSVQINVNIDANAEVVGPNSSAMALKTSERSDLTVTVGAKNKGTFDGMSTDNVFVGWACDPDDYNRQVDISLYKDGPEGKGVLLGTVKADQPGEEAIGGECGGTRNHRFNFSIPESAKNATPFSVYAYGTDVQSSVKYDLLSSSRSFNCVQGVCSEVKNCTTVTDNFDGTTIDPAKWQTNIFENDTITIENGKLKIAEPQGVRDGGTSLFPKATLKGDFTVEVDLAGVTINNKDGWATGLIIVGPGNDYKNQLRFIRNYRSPTDQFGFLMADWFNGNSTTNQWTNIKNIDLTDSTTPIRVKITRTGNTVEWYYNKGAGYQLAGQATNQLFSYEETANLYTGHWNTRPPLTGFFDNFSQSYNCVSQSSATLPTALWKFDEGSGTTVSDLVKVRNGTWTGSGNNWTLGKYGSAGNLEGTNYLKINDDDVFSSKQFTMNAWVKWDGKRYAVTGGKDYATIFSKGPTASGEFNLQLHRLDTSIDTNLVAYVNGKSIDWRNSSIDTNWHYISMTYDGSIARLYFDGREVAFLNIDATVQNTTNPLVFGALTDGTSGWGGAMDLVSFYDYVRSPSQIGEDMKYGLVPGTVTPTNGQAITSGPLPTPGGPTATGAPTPTTGPASAMTINLSLKFQGIAKVPKAEQNGMVTKVTARNVKAGANQTVDVTLTTSDGVKWGGVGTFNIPTGGGYSLYIKGPKHIQKKICDDKAQEANPGTYRCDEGKIVLNPGANTLDFTGITQLVGDLPDQNGVVDSYDISLVRTNLGKSDADALKKADLNLDGIVDTQDYALLINALSIRSDEGEAVGTSNQGPTPTGPQSTGDLLRDGTTYPLYASLLLDSVSCYSKAFYNSPISAMTPAVLSSTSTIASLPVKNGTSDTFLIGNISVNDLLSKDLKRGDAKADFNGTAKIKLTSSALNYEKLLNDSTVSRLEWCTSTSGCLGVSDDTLKNKKFVSLGGLKIYCQ